MLKKLFYKTFIDTENAREQYASSHRSFDYKAMVICIVTAFSLSVIYYWGHYELLRKFLVSLDCTSILQKTDGWFGDSRSENFGNLFYWVLVLFVFYFIIPVIFIKIVFKENLADYGLKLKGAFKDYHLYLFMLLVMIPLVIYFSGTESFQARYPFLRINQEVNFLPRLIKWELLYAVQFFALEFFFRGFVLHGLKHRLGFYSVFVMTIPYCMIHFGKPMPETLAAIVAGVVLGCLSLKSRSILLGFLIHVSVGLGMDIAALWQKGFFK